MIRIELHGFRAESSKIMNEVRALLLSTSYVETSRIRLAIVGDIVVDMENHDAPFIRVISNSERDTEISVLLRRFYPEVEFIKAEYLR